MDKLIVLDANSESIKYLCNRDKRLAKVISMVGSISYRVHSDPYSFLIHEIIEQMLSLKAGQKIYERFEKSCGGNITPDAVDKLTNDEIKSIGTASSKVRSIRCITNAVVNKELFFNKFELMSDMEVVKELIKYYGIGMWTAKMFLIFVLDRNDVLPFEDVAFLQSYRWMYKTDDCTKVSVENRCKKWKPYSSIAARYLYRALDSGLTQNEFHLFK